MDQFNANYFDDSTDMPSFKNGNNNDNTNSNNFAMDPSLLDESATYGDFDFESFLNTPLDHGTLPQSAYPESPLMAMNFQPTIGYHEEYSGQPSGTMNPVTSSPATGANQTQAAQQGSYLIPSRPVLSVVPIDSTLPGQDPMQDGQYRNPILNAFSSPITPLQVIDRIQFPFDDQLRVALQGALEHEQQEIAAGVRDGFAPRAPAQPSSSRRIATIKKEPGNKRTENIRSFNPAEFYSPLESRPASWGSINPDTGDQLFQYTEHGELNPLHSFKVGQIIEYMSMHPLHNSRMPNSRRSGLKLWVQTVPADSGRRYPHKSSDKCRFFDCPDPLRTIRKGEFRIAFDEQSTRRKTDPYHTAGYVHLYCMEKFLDFPQICKNYNVIPDTRNLKEGKNRMAIDRDHQSMAAIVQGFIVDSIPWADFGTGRRPKDYYEHTLSFLLTQEHLDKQPKHLSRIRELRGGNHLDIHRNNLDIRLVNAQTLQKLKSNKALAAPKPLQKRKAELQEESVLDDNILESPRKRAKKSSTLPAPISTRRTSRSVKGRTISSSDSASSPERRRTRSATSMDSQKSKVQSPTISRKRASQEDPDFIPSRKRKSSDFQSTETKRRRSPKAPGFDYPTLKF